MKKTFVKTVSVIAAAVLTVTTFTCINTGTSLAADFSFAGSSSNTTSDIKIGSKDTGADYTRIELGANGGQSIGTNRIINIVEADLSKTNLSFEVINHGTYTTSLSTVPSAVSGYSKSGKTILAAVNGDWFHNAKTYGAVEWYTVPVGVTLIGGEIWNSHITSQEIAYDGPYSFGVTKQNQPVIGRLKVQTTIKNTTKNKTVTADGLNRAPANNAIYVYNNRLGSNNYVNTDAYELVLKINGSNKFSHNGTVTGTVIDIYPSGTASRSAALNDSTVIITARGSKTSQLSDNFSKGDTVAITTALADDFGNTALWANVDYAIGGHIMILKDGQVFDATLNGNQENYPSNIIGFKDDGTVMMCMVTSNKNGTRTGLKFSQMIDFCQTVGYNTCFLLDGGGSTTMVTLESGNYVERACYSDGSIRSVINSLALVYNDTKVCDSQGSLSHITVPETLSPSAEGWFEMPANKLTWSLGNSDGSMKKSSDGVIVKQSNGSPAWPVATLTQTIKASEYPIADIFYKTKSTGLMGIYMAAGANTPSGCADFKLEGDGALHYHQFKLTGNVSTPTFPLHSDPSKNETEFIKIVFYKSEAARTAYLNKYHSSASNSTNSSQTTAKPTSAPTAKPTSAPTTKPTSAPTAKPTSAQNTAATAPAANSPGAASSTNSDKPTSNPTAENSSEAPEKTANSPSGTADSSSKPTEQANEATVKPAETAASSVTEKASGCSGCGSSINSSCSLILIIVIASALVLFRKKHTEN